MSDLNARLLAAEINPFDSVWASDAKRLALELECILLSTDLPAATKWWDSAHEALELHKQICNLVYVEMK